MSHLHVCLKHPPSSHPPLLWSQSSPEITTSLTTVFNSRTLRVDGTRHHHNQFECNCNPSYQPDNHHCMFLLCDTLLIILVCCNFIITLIFNTNIVFITSRMSCSSSKAWQPGECGKNRECEGGWIEKASRVMRFASAHVRETHL